MKSSSETLDPQSVRLFIKGRQVTLKYGNRQHTFKLGKGMKYLAALLSHHDQPILYEQLEHPDSQLRRQDAGNMFYEGMDEHELYPESEYLQQPMADPVTLRAVKDRLNLVIFQLAETSNWNDYCQKDDLLEEKE